MVSGCPNPLLSTHCELAAPPLLADCLAPILREGLTEPDLHPARLLHSPYHALSSATSLAPISLSLLSQLCQERAMALEFSKNWVKSWLHPFWLCDPVQALLLYLSFLICEMGLTVPAFRVIVKIRESACEN